ncbi:MAG: hypothetical protein ACR2I0_01910, partial [Rhodoferax sp.]
MTEVSGQSASARALRWRQVLLGGALLLAVCTAQARDLGIGYVFAPDDERYESKRLERSFPGHPLGRPRAGIEVAIEESAFQLSSASLKVTLQDVPLESAAQARTQMLALAKKGVRHFVLDLPGPMVAELGKS